MNALPIDLDAEAIQFDGHWYTRDELARRIKGMLDSGDFAISKPSQALEQLTTTLGSLRTLAVRVAPDMADALNAHAARQGRGPGAIIRTALAEYLGLPPPLEADRSAHARPPSPPGRKPTDPEMPIAAALPVPPDLKVTQQMSIPPGLLAGPPQLIPGPGALKAASIPQAAPSVVIDRSAIVTEEPTAEEAAQAVSLTPKSKEEEAVERRWFGQ